jgi:hypothetical protein
VPTVHFPLSTAHCLLHTICALTLRPPTIRLPVHFQSRRSYRPAEGCVEAKRRQRPGPPPATTNPLLAEPGGGPWVNCAWVKVSRGRFVGGRIVKAPILFTPHCLLPNVYCPLFTAHYLLPLFTAHCLLPIVYWPVYCPLPTAQRLLSIAPCPAAAVLCPLSTVCAHCLLPNVYYPPVYWPSTYCPLPTAHCPLPTIYCPLFTAHCLLSTVYWPVPTVSYPGKGECADPVNEDAILEKEGGGESPGRNKERQLASDTGGGKT